jgi:nitrate/nitrite-specific signal transduction histidine kinase
LADESYLAGRWNLILVLRLIGSSISLGIQLAGEFVIVLCKQPSGDEELILPPILRTNNIRTKVVIWCFFPALVILVIAAWFTFYAYQKNAVELTLRNDQEQVQYLVQQVNTDLGVYMNPFFTPLLFDEEFISLEAEQQRAAVIASERLARAFDGGWFVFQEQGLVEASNPHRPDLIGQDWSGDPLVQLALENLGSGYFSSIVPLGPNGEPVILTAVSILTRQPGYSAVLMGMLRVDPNPDTALNRMFTAMNLGPAVFLVDSFGRVLYHPNTALVGRDFNHSPSVQQVFSQRPQRQIFNQEGSAIAVSFAPVLRNGEWRLVKEQSLSELMQPSLTFTLMLLGLLALGVIIPSVFVGIGLRRIIQPIRDLTAAAQNVASGNFSQKIEVSSNDELAELAEQFNRMSAELQASYSMLEKRVAARTRHLATLNAIAAATNRSLDLEESLSAALEQTLLAMELNAGAAYCLTEDAELKQVVQRGLTPAFFDELAEWEALYEVFDPAYPSTSCLETGALPQENLRAALEAGSICQLVLVVLRAKGRPVGLMCLGAGSAPLRAEELALLQSIGEQAAVAVENARLYEKAEETAVAEERSRLARDLHDAVTQTLFAASLTAEALPQVMEIDPELGRTRLAELRGMTRGALAEMRTLLLELRPGALVEERLENLLRQLAEATGSRARLSTRLELQGSGRLPGAVQTAFYRTAQEALNNVSKHACASEVSIWLNYDPRRAEMVIVDNGVGFILAPASGSHFGLAIMQERAASTGGWCTIRSEPGAGTQIRLEWPALDGNQNTGKD